MKCPQVILVYGVIFFVCTMAGTIDERQISSNVSQKKQTESFATQLALSDAKLKEFKNLINRNKRKIAERRQMRMQKYGGFKEK